MVNILIRPSYISKAFIILKSCIFLYGQVEFPFNSKLDYLKYLLKNKYYYELEDEKHEIFNDTLLQSIIKDSSALLITNFYFSRNNYDSILSIVNKYSIANPDIFCSINKKIIFIKYFLENDSNKFEMEKTCLNNKSFQDYKTLLIMGIALKNNQFTDFDSLLTYSNNIYDPVIRKEINYLTYLRNQKRKYKSKAVSLILSSLIPGLGKVYTNNNGQALSMFLSNVLFAGLTLESYYRLGIKHPQTIIFAGAFLSFYLANLYGSVLSVKYYNIEKKNEKLHNIFVSLSVPLK
jgi:hypothetical protein